MFVYVGFHLSCPHSRLRIPPLYRHSDNLPVLQEKDDSSAEEQKKNNKEEEGGLQEEKKKERSFVLQPQQHQQQQRFLSTARGLFQENASSAGLGGSNLSMAINRRRIFSLEPFHQSSIISSRQKRGREEEREEEGEEEDRTGNPNKKTKLTNGKSYSRWSFSSIIVQITDIITHFIL